jgi:hypothetical protein
MTFSISYRLSSCLKTLRARNKHLLEVIDYIEINTWPFPYHPETPISARDAVEGLYGSRDESRYDMEKVGNATIEIYGGRDALVWQ